MMPGIDASGRSHFAGQKAMTMVESTTYLSLEARVCIDMRPELNSPSPPRGSTESAPAIVMAMSYAQLEGNSRLRSYETDCSPDDDTRCLEVIDEEDGGKKEEAKSKLTLPPSCAQANTRNRHVRGQRRPASVQATPILG